MASAKKRRSAILSGITFVFYCHRLLSTKSFERERSFRERGRFERERSFRERERGRFEREREVVSRERETSLDGETQRRMNQLRIQYCSKSKLSAVYRATTCVCLTLFATVLPLCFRVTKMSVIHNNNRHHHSMMRPIRFLVFGTLFQAMW